MSLYVDYALCYYQLTFDFRVINLHSRFLWLSSSHLSYKQKMKRQIVLKRHCDSIPHIYMYTTYCGTVQLCKRLYAILHVHYIISKMEGKQTHFEWCGNSPAMNLKVYALRLRKCTTE